MTRQHPVEEYKQAFMQFADAGKHEFLITKGDGAIVYYEQQTYRICHYDDLLEDFKEYFADDFSMIYTELPYELWEIIYDRHVDITEEDLIIDIYNSWKLYWDNQHDHFESVKDYEKAKKASFDEFKLLVDRLKAQPGKFIANAVAISDITLIPVIALAIRSRFKNEEDFYRECLDEMIETFPANFGEDGNFDEVEIVRSSGQTASYYIFMPGYNYHDVLKLYS